MALLFYSLLTYLAMPVLLLRLWLRGRKEPQLLRNWRERLGYAPRSGGPVIWVHAVSVGETIAAAPIVRTLRQLYPNEAILVTAMTMTGSERARALFGDSVEYAYIPYDYPSAISRFLRRVRPRALIIMETELWPNIVAKTHATGAPVIIANARLSEGSAEGYKKVRWLSRKLFGQLDWIAAQAESDARRFVDVGASPEAITVTGSIKFDVSVSAQVREESKALRTLLGPSERPIWIAASTHEGEDAQLLAAHRQLMKKIPNLLLVLVPRHPERFRAVGRLIQERGFTLASRSRQQTEGDVYLADTMGELLMLYGVADLAFVGGSLVKRGGHNPLEAAAWGIPVISGPHVFNFSDIYDRLERGQGLIRVSTPAELVDQVYVLLSSKSERETVGRNAESVLVSNQGALDRLMIGIEAKIERRRKQC